MSIMLTSEQWDELQEQIDTLDNLKTSLVVMTTLPDRIHVEALRGSLPRTVQALKDFSTQIEGDNE